MKFDFVATINTKVWYLSSSEAQRKPVLLLWVVKSKDSSSQILTNSERIVVVQQWHTTLQGSYNLHKVNSCIFHFFIDKHISYIYIKSENFHVAPISHYNSKIVK